MRSGRSKGSGTAGSPTGDPAGSAAPGLHAELTARARPWVEAKLATPAMQGILAGTLHPAVMRRWVEQDYIYLHTYTRVFAHLASLAPDHHLETLVDGAHYTIHIETQHLAELAPLFGADLGAAEIGPACASYTEFLRTNGERFETGIVAVLPCMVGFASLGLVVEPPTEPRFRRWIEIYASGDFQSYTARFARIVDELVIDPALAADIFETGLRHEIDFWDDAFTAASAPTIGHDALTPGTSP